MTPTWYAYGTGGTALAPTPGGGLRTSYNGVPGASGTYQRYGTVESFLPPYTFAFDLLVRSRRDPYAFEWGGAAGYDPSIVIHPMHGMDDTPAHANEENIIMRFGGRSSDLASVSAELGDRSGFRTGFTNRERGPNFDPVGRGWMRVEVNVLAHDHYTLHVAGEQLIDLTEKQPATMSGPVGIGLRLDFFDAEIRNVTVNEGEPMLIPGVEIVKRAGWLGSTRVFSGPAMMLWAVDTFVVHYTAAKNLPDGDPGELGKVRGYLSTMAAYYWRVRMYALGYNFAVDWEGIVYELRGWDIKCAANLNWNDRSIAVLCLVDGDDPMPPAMLRSVNAIYAEADRRTGRRCQLKGHGDIGSTSCPGMGIRTQIRVGQVRPQPIGVSTAPILTEKEDPMNYLSEHRRIIDTRQTGGIIKAGEVRKVELGMLNIAALSVEAISGGASGWLSVGGTPKASSGTSVLNYDADGVANASLVGGFPDGHAYIKAHHGACHVVVDMQGFGAA